MLLLKAERSASVVKIKLKIWCPIQFYFLNAKSSLAFPWCMTVTHQHHLPGILMSIPINRDTLEKCLRTEKDIIQNLSNESVIFGSKLKRTEAMNYRHMIPKALNG